MRIPDSTAYTTFLSDLQNTQQAMQVAEEQVSSGKKVEKPSDDPAGAADIVRISGETALNNQFSQNLTSVTGRLTTADNSLSSVQDMLNQIQTVGLEAQNTTANPSASTAELTALSSQILAVANQTNDGRYIFGGSVTTTAPFVQNSDSSVSYVGNSNAVTLQVGRNTALPAQIPGNQIFTEPANLFSTISSLVTAINAGDQTGIQTQVSQLQQVAQQISTARSQIGGYVDVATSMQSQLTNDGLSDAQELSDVQSANSAQAITDLTLTQTNLQATLQVGAKIAQLSLLDYLK